MLIALEILIGLHGGKETEYPSVYDQGLSKVFHGRNPNCGELAFAMSGGAAVALCAIWADLFSVCIVKFDHGGLESLDFTNGYYGLSNSYYRWSGGARERSSKLYERFTPQSPFTSTEITCPPR